MIITRYIHKEILQKLAWIVGLLILIFASNKFVGFLSDAAEGALYRQKGASIQVSTASLGRKTYELGQIPIVGLRL